MKESIKMAKSDGFLAHSTPIHKTKNLPLRWFANGVSSPISHRYLSKSLGIYFADEDKVIPLTTWRKFKMDNYYKLYKLLGIPYEKWGTTYTINMDAWRHEFYQDEILERLGSDYDENGIPYWEKDN